MNVFAKRNSIAGFVAAVLVFAMAPQAGAVLLTELQEQTVTAQLFEFEFGGAPMSDGGTAIFTVHGRGDYANDPNESLTWDIEGLLSGTLGQFEIGGTGGVGGPYDSIIEHVADRNYEFVRTYVISAADLLAITADGLISVSVQYGSGINVLEAIEFMEISFEYNAAAVSEPATLAIFGLGLLMMGVARRRSSI